VDEEKESEDKSKVEALLKEDKERHNQALLGRLENSVSAHFNKYLQVIIRFF